MFEGCDLKRLWKKDPKMQFVKPYPTEVDITACEHRIGFKLPLSYIELMQQTQNGGLLEKDTIQLKDENGNVTKSMTCTFLDAIGEKLYSLEERKRLSGLAGLPDIGVYFASHVSSRRAERFVLDYSLCGSTGEPSVSFVKGMHRDGKSYYETTFIASNFEAFIKMLKKAPKLPPFDYNSLKEQLTQAAKQAFSEMYNNHNNEKINAFALYIDDTASMICPAVNTDKNAAKTNFPAS